MKKFLRACLIAASLVLPGAMISATTSAQDNVVDSIKKEITKHFPDIAIERVTKTPHGNLFEIFTGTEIFYTDEKVSFIMVGSVVDPATKQNVTDARLSRLTAIRFDDLPFDRAIKLVRGNGTRRMAIFEDPNCGYCKRFEADINTLDNITAYIFLYPILSPDSLVKSRALWCAKDRLGAWQDWMLRDKMPAPATEDCKAPIEDNVMLGQKFRINGTPVTFFEDGERLSGALPKERIEAKLAATDKSSKTVAPLRK